MNSDGSGQRRIAVRAEAFAVWSSDGDTLAFPGGFGGRATLNTVGSAGTGRRVVTREGEYDCLWPASHHPADDARHLAWQPLTQKPTASLPHTGANLRTALIAAALLLIAGILARAASRRPARRRGTKKQGRPGEMMMISSLCFSTSIDWWPPA